MEKIMSLYKEDFAISLLKIKEQIVIRAINHKIGDNWEKNELFNRCQFVIYQDNREVFVFDGEELVEFYHPEFTTETLGIQPRITATVDYKELYKNESKSN